MGTCPLNSDEVIPKGIKEFARQALQNLADAQDMIIEARAFQTHYANNHQMNKPKITKGDLVFLSIKNLNLPLRHAHKLCLKFIGPYKILYKQDLRHLLTH